MIIYKTTNLINGKFYIGKDVKNDPNYLGSGLLLNNAIKKYGIDNFKKEILDECDDKNELAKREIYWIDKLNATDRSVAYNIANGGLGGDTFTNNPNKEEIRKTHSKATSKMMKKRGGYFNDKNKQKKACINGGKSHLGKKRSNETKQKISKALTGRIIDETWRENISKATKKAMSKLDQKELQRKALEGRQKAWKKRDDERIRLIKEMKGRGIKSKDIIKELKISPPTFYRLLKIVKSSYKK